MPFENIKEINDLKVSDIIRHKAGGKSWIVINHYGTHLTAVQTVHVSNPSEWEVFVIEPTNQVNL